MSGRLVEALRRVLPSSSPAALEAWLAPSAPLLEQLTVDPDRLAPLLSPHLAGELAGLRAHDLVLAAAALAGDPVALRELEAVVVDEVRRAVSPIDPAPHAIDEVTQLVRERLLVRPAKLADYAGQGPLGAWVRAVSVRVALNARRPGAREDPVSQVPDQPLLDPDPELALLRARHRAAFRDAFAAAVAELTPRERTLLRLTTLDGLTLAQVGTMYGKDASTISRWLAAGRERLLDVTRARLAGALGVSGSALESVMRAADSELHVSLSRMLASSSSA